MRAVKDINVGRRLKTCHRALLGRVSPKLTLMRKLLMYVLGDHNRIRPVWFALSKLVCFWWDISGLACRLFHTRGRHNASRSIFGRMVITNC